MVERLEWDKYDGMNGSPEGEFVTYADYAALAARLAETERVLTAAMRVVFRYADTMLRLQPEIREAGRLVAEIAERPADRESDDAR